MTSPGWNGRPPSFAGFSRKLSKDPVHSLEIAPVRREIVYGATDSMRAARQLIVAEVRIAPPEMFLNAGPLPHVICSSVEWDRGGDNEATAWRLEEN